MKNLITILMCTFFLNGILAQNADGPGRKIPPTTPEIQALYAQQKNLKSTGNSADLEKNRQAIIAAWQEIDSAIAAEFKPTQITQAEPFISKSFHSATNSNNSIKPLWGDDILIYSGVVDGVDIDTALDGTIYVADYEKLQNNDILRISKSTDNGVSFSNLITYIFGPQDLTKIKLTIMDKGPNKYLFVTYSDFDGSLVNMRFNIDGGPLNTISEIIVTDVKEFDIAVDYEFETQAQLYALYTKSDNSLYSARSAADGSGMNWGDEHNFGYVARECAISYGNGNTFATFTGFNSGNLYFSANNGFNDPTGWETARIISDGSIWDSKDIGIAAERLPLSDYRVLVVSSQRLTGTPDDYYGSWARVTEGDIEGYSVPNTIGDIGFWDTWCRKVDDNTVIQASFQNKTDASCNITKYNAGFLDDPEVISNNPITSQKGSSAVAEDTDGNAIAVYIGENRTGLYFDTKGATAAVHDNTLSNFIYYPNPASTILTLKAQSNISNVAVYNLLGQQVKVLKPNALSSELNVADLSAGAYVMKVTIGNEIGTYKIIKN